MSMYDTDVLIEQIFSDNTRIDIYQSVTGMYYGSVFYKKAHIYYSSMYDNMDMIPILCRAWIKTNVIF